MVGIDGLREALEQGIAQNLDFDSHEAKLEELREMFSHSIVMLPFDEPLQECNCVMHAMDFRMEEPSSLFGRFYADTKYLRRLIDTGHLSEIYGSPENGSLAVYWNGDKVEHVGVANEDGRVVSKWGIGYLYDHEPWEVPSSYGRSIRYFAPIDPDDAYEFLEALHTAKL